MFSPDEQKGRERRRHRHVSDTPCGQGPSHALTTATLNKLVVRLGEASQSAWEADKKENASELHRRAIGLSQ